MASRLPSNDRLDRIRRKYRLARYELAEIMGVTKSAVDRWLRPQGNPHRTEMPDSYIRLLELELGLVAPQYTKIEDGRARL